MTDHIVKIKPLDWYHDEPTQAHYAEGAFAHYVVQDLTEIEGLILPDDAIKVRMEVRPLQDNVQANKFMDFETLDEAKRAAYMHHAQAVAKFVYGVEIE